MKVRLVAHLVLFATLLGLAAWFAYRGIAAPTQIGPLEINLETAAMVWFAVLIYGLVGLLLYYPLRGRSASILIIGHSVAAAIALASNAAVVTLGHRHSAPPADTIVEDDKPAGDLPGAGAPPGQPLPLPEPGAATEPQSSMENSR
jgi:hypothetical protein